MHRAVKMEKLFHYWKNRSLSEGPVIFPASGAKTFEIVYTGSVRSGIYPLRQGEAYVNRRMAFSPGCS
jgi:hypothetical protein